MRTATADDPARTAMAASAARGARRDRLAPTVAATIVLVAGLVNLLSIVVPRLVNVPMVDEALQLAFPGVVRPGAVAATAAAGVGLLLLADGLRRRNRVAWRVAVTLLAVSVLLHLLLGTHIEQAVVQGAMLGWLVANGRQFGARAGPRERRRLVLPVLALLALTVAYGLVGLRVNAPALVAERGYGLDGGLGEVVRMAAGQGASVRLHGGFGRVFPGSVAALFLTGVLVIAVRALAPRRARSAAPPTAAELADADDSLAYFATRDDRVTVRGPSGGIISYGAVGRIALAAGDPLGPPAAWSEAITAFLSEAATTGRVPAVMGCGRRAAKLYEQAGLRRVYLGDEAVLDLAAFDLKGHTRRKARQAWERAERAGLRAELRRAGELDGPTKAELRALSDRWLGGTAERGFSMALSRLFDPRDTDAILVIGRDRDGRLLGLLHLVPWGRDGASLDVMRRDRAAPGVLNDFLVVEAARQLPALGVRRLSLNFSFLRGLLVAAEDERASAWAHAQARVLRLLSKPYQIESLYLFNKKFDPAWHARHCMLESAGDAPAVAWAMLRAEGFVRSPWSRAAASPAAVAPVTAPAVAMAAAAEVAGAPAAADLTPSRPQLGRQELVRRDKLERLRAAGIDPYPVGFTPTHTLDQVRAGWDRLAPGEESGDVVRVAGRVMVRRSLGGLTFWVLRHFDDTLQVMLAADTLGAAFQAAVDHDPGDWVGVTGPVVRSRRGELSVKAAAVTLLCKSLRPLPDKRHGLTDLEARSRQRELDLTVTAEARRAMRLRIEVLRALRQVMAERGYVEVETPILHPLHGGALARPFVTHHNALGTDFYLRIASELYLKRLLVGGAAKVYELNRMFRNEGLSTRHNPEFTMLECNEVFADYRDMMRLATDLVRAAADAVDADKVTVKGQPVDLHAPWREVSVLDAVREALELPDLAYDWPPARLREVCARTGVPAAPDWGPGRLVMELFEAHCEHRILEPTFVVDYPAEVSPLAHPHRDDPFLTERFELFIGGREYGNAFSELTDPLEQRARFEAQALAKAGGDVEAMVVDEAYLRALELGLPPNAGLGIGVDRLVMLLGGYPSIREVLLFPALRPEER